MISETGSFSILGTKPLYTIFSKYIMKIMVKSTKVSSCGNYIMVPRDKTLRQYLFEDFDGDGVKNIDDPFPFDKQKSKWPDPKKNPTYYHRARYGGFDTKFSTVLLDIERNNNNHGSLMRSFIKENPGAEGRVKTIPSTIGKLAKWSLGNMHDVAGAKVVTRDRVEAKRKTKQIRKRYKTDRKEYDDFYRKPGKGGYRAFHIGLLGVDDRRCEVQVKSKPMDDLAVKMHGKYKKGHKDLDWFEKESNRLFKLGF